MRKKLLLSMLRKMKKRIKKSLSRKMIILKSRIRKIRKKKRNILS